MLIRLRNWYHDLWNRIQRPMAIKVRELAKADGYCAWCGWNFPECSICKKDKP